MTPRQATCFLVITALGCARTPPLTDPMRAAIARGELRRVTSVLATRDGKMITEGYFASANAETLHNTRSAMKSVTALAVGIAIAEGKIPSAQAPAFAFLADLRPFAHDDPAKASIQIEDLLTMSSALDCDDNDDGSPGNEEKMYPLEHWARWAVDLPVKASYQRDESGRGPFHYCTAGVFLLGQIVQRAVGEPFDQWVDRKLFRPMGIEKSEWSRSPSGEVMTGGGLLLRSRDLAKLGQLVLDEGRWNGQALVPAAWIANATTLHRYAFPDTGYGYLFWQRDYTTECGTRSAWYMSGNGGNEVVIFRDMNATAVVTTTNYNTKGMHQQTFRLIADYVLPMIGCR